MDKYKKRKSMDKMFIIVVLIILISCISNIFFERAINTKTRFDFDYSEKGNSTYKVYLKENSFYETDYLEENMQYVSGLIDYIDVDFDYDFNSEEKSNYDYNYDVTAKIVVLDRDNDSKVLFSKEELLVNKTDRQAKEVTTFNVEDNVQIDYGKYNKIVNDFRSEYGIAVESYLTVSMRVNTIVKEVEHFENLQNTNTVSIQIPLSKNTIDITKSDINNEKNAYVMSNTEVINVFCFVIFIILTIADLILVMSLYHEIRKFLLKKRTPYIKKLNKIMKEYDRAIVETKEGFKVEDKNIIDVKSFEELLDARDSLNNMILYVNVKEGEECWFILRYEGNIYRYVLKATELEKKGGR